MNAIHINPLFVKEVRTLFRGKGFPIVLNSYLGLVAVILAGASIMSLSRSYTTYAWEMGRSIVLGLGIYQLIALGLIAPALTAATMSLERDRDTFDVLMVMPLGLARIVFYKTLAALMFLIMLVMVSLPLLAGGFVLGGVAPGELAVVALLTLLAMLVNGALGLMFSSLFKRTIIAVPGACLMAGIMTVVTAFWLYMTDSPLALRYANPIIALYEFMQGAQIGLFSLDAPVWLPALVLLSLAGLLCLAIATEGFRFKFRRRYAMVGFILVLLCAAMLFFELGESLHAMPEQLDSALILRLSLYVMLFMVFAAILDPMGTQRTSALYPKARKSIRTVLSALFCPGLGLTVMVWVAVTSLWLSVACFYPALRVRSGVMYGAPLLAGMTALFYSALGRFVVSVWNWKRGYMARIIAGVVFVILVGLPHVVSMVLHAADNQAASQPLDLLLLVSPALACNSLGDDILTPYPFLAETLGNREFWWVTLGVYAVLALMFFSAAKILRLYRNRRRSV